MQCLGEMATWLPLPGAIPQYCARYIDPAMGFAVGWVGPRLPLPLVFFADSKVEQLVPVRNHALRRNLCRRYCHYVLER